MIRLVRESIMKKRNTPMVEHPVDTHKGLHVWCVYGGLVVRWMTDLGRAGRPYIRLTLLCPRSTITILSKARRSTTLLPPPRKTIILAKQRRRSGSAIWCRGGGEGAAGRRLPRLVAPLRFVPRLRSSTSFPGFRRRLPYLPSFPSLFLRADTRPPGVSFCSKRYDQVHKFEERHLLDPFYDFTRTLFLFVFLPSFFHSLSFVSSIEVRHPYDKTDATLIHVVRYIRKIIEETWLYSNETNIIFFSF